MSKEANLAILGKFAEAAEQLGKIRSLPGKAVSAENVDHDPADGQVQGPEGCRTFFSGLRNAFSGSQRHARYDGCGQMIRLRSRTRSPERRTDRWTVSLPTGRKVRDPRLADIQI